MPSNQDITPQNGQQEVRLDGRTPGIWVGRDMHTNREVNLRAGGKFTRKFNYQKQLCYLVFVGSSIDMSVTSSVAHFLLRTSQCQVLFLG